MASTASRARALSLYRSLLRSSRTWPGPEHEKAWIKEEAVQRFRQNRDLSDPKMISAKISEGENQYEIAWHYKIPYPRLHNIATGTVVDHRKKFVMPEYSEVPRENGDPADDLPGLRKPSATCGEMCVV